MTRLKRLRGLALAAACLGMASAAHAGDPSARDWIPAPPGTNVIASYLAALGSHGFYDRGHRVEGGPEIDVQALVLRPMAFRKLGNFTVQYELIAPAYRTRAKVPGSPSESMTGLGDVQAGMAIWLYNNEETRTWFAWEPFITFPTGHYHGSRADVSAGKNRWTTVQDLAFVKGVGESTFLEAVAEFEFYGDNDNYYGQTLEKDPSTRLMFLASTNINPSTYVGLRYRYETGGREKINGNTVVSSQNSHQLAAEITYQINNANQIQLQYIHDLDVRNGPKMRGVQLRYAYMF
ncbi:transporter [Allopusillimonas soli]|uniref:Transporter n=1 Tax=Allopusillimonas soli TaxID=659016 RepID=A0A853FB50_9BURK|nr:transporter [Allopusillimonas soli]NYT37323.1 transporter [Allopusillimonas soli]TEA74690.1 transporter [Allopusillimonas soli]